MKEKEVVLTEKQNGLYLDEFKRVVLVDFFTKKAYFVEKEDQKKARLYLHRYSLSVICAVIAGFFTSYIIAACAGVALALLLTLTYYFVFLKKLSAVESYRMDEKTKVMTDYNNSDRQKNTMRMIVAIALVIVCIIYIYQQTNGFSANMNSANMILMIVACAGLIIYAGLIAIKSYKALKQ